MGGHAQLQTAGDQLRFGIILPGGTATQQLQQAVAAERAGDREAAAAMVAPWADAGATWWMETRWEMPHDSDGRMRQVEQRIAAGPPRPA